MKKEVLKKSLDSFTKEGVSSSAAASITDNFISPLAIAFNATAQEIGLLTSLPNLASSIIQIKVPKLFEKFKSRKDIILPFTFLSIILLVLLIAIPSFTAKYAVKLIILSFSVYIILRDIAAPAIGGLISDLVPRNIEGKYFGKRTYLTGSAALLAFFISGFILQFSGEKFYFGFIFIFAVAIIARLISLYYFNDIYEPKFKYNHKYYFSFIQFLKKTKDNNFARFSISIGFMDFSMALAYPFFVWYLLKDLNFSYGIYTLIIVAGSIATLLTVKKWGEYSDRYGNIKLVKLSALLISFTPLLWTFNSNIIYLSIVSIYSGFATAGFNLCITDFIYDSTSTQKRAICISYVNAIRGLSIFFGATLGGFLVTRVPLILGYKVLTLFWISWIVRLTAAIIISHIKEVRPVRHMDGKNLFLKLSGIGPVYETVQHNIHRIRYNK